MKKLKHYKPILFLFCLTVLQLLIQPIANADQGKKNPSSVVAENNVKEETVQTSDEVCLDSLDYGASKPGAQILLSDCNGDPKPISANNSDETILTYPTVLTLTETSVETSPGICSDSFNYGANHYIPNKPGSIALRFGVFTDTGKPHVQLCEH